MASNSNLFIPTTKVSPSGREDRVLRARALRSTCAAFAIAFTLSAVPATAQWDCPEVAATPESCGQSICPENGIQASDALEALKAAVGTSYCAPCRCDVDANGAITASDPLRILRSAVGQPISLSCSTCNALVLHPVEDAPPSSPLVAVDSPATTRTRRATWNPYSSIVLDDGRTAELGRRGVDPLNTRIRLYDQQDALISERILFTNVYGDGKLDCAAGTQRCVTRWRNFSDGETSLTLRVFDLDDLSKGGGMTVRKVESESDTLTEITTGASATSYACEQSGICVASWLLTRTTIVDQDYSDTETLRYEARAFHVGTGELGPETILGDAAPDSFAPPFVEPLGEGRFRVTLPTQEILEFEVR